ncbi:MAG: dipeptide ABC transporter ATP-binding protein [Rickettsiales bacterium]|jgi:microcin C transport system ATP-binding protein|nr:dipeptide ABC transporter ATP-binding protein [Rickettsiales bacterium]
MTLLSLSNLCLSFGEKQVIKNLSLSIERGEMLALVGESGSGKSLTALSIMGLEPAGAKLNGHIRFGDDVILSEAQAESKDLRSLVYARDDILRPLRGKRISMIFQEPMTALNPLHTIGKQIEEIITIHQKHSPNHASNVLTLLDQVGLSHFKDRLDAYPHQLSGGERQRVMIAMAIANKPDLLIADEPTTAVDVTIQKKILELLKELQKEMGMAILFITHDLTVVKRLCDRVAVMKQGELLEQGKVADVFTAPKHPYTQLLLSSEPKGKAVAIEANAPQLLSCESLRVHFPIKKGLLRRTVGHVKAVDGIDLTLARGECIGIVGESGSGKTTLGFALLKLIKSEGEIAFSPTTNHQPPTTHFRKHMQLVFQDPYSSLSPRMTVEQIIGEGLDVHEPHLSSTERSTKIRDILIEVGLDETALHRFPHEFSGGQRQRISIARSVVLRPQLLVLDEPTSALDLTIQSQIIDLLKNLQRKYQMSYVFISHDLRVIRAIAHRIIVMKQGKVVETGDTKQILEHPREDYTKTLIDAAFLNN